jgi:formylglycine-generating enzyme required for sulfatase activity
MVLVPGGVFTMGRDDGPTSEQPAHQVRLSTYYIDQHEVTVGQFNRFLKATVHNPERDRAIAREPAPVPTSEDSPAVMVSAKEARDYASWAGKRLPTEAQWEKAARGAEGRIYPTGANPPEAGKPHDPRRLAPILSRADDVSPFGAYDMAGNAWEWTKDWYDPRFFQLSKNQVVDDPAGPVHVPRTYQLAVKGGSPTWTLTKREGLKFDQRLPYLGFRCVLQVEGPGNAFEAEKPKAAPAPDAGDAGGGPAVPVPF